MADPHNPALGLGLLVAVGAALGVGVFALARPSPPSPAPAPSPPRAADGPVVLPVLVEPRAPPARARLARGVPPSVLETADVRAAPWAPGLRLRATEIGTATTAWEERRAEIEDLTTKDVRRYRIGDLLPHGSLLVGIAAGHVDVLVADRELVRLTPNGRVRSIEDFRTADEARPLRRARALDEAFRDAVDAAIQATLSDDPAEVQAAIDALIDAGAPVVPLVAPHVDSTLAVAWYDYGFPSTGTRRGAPRVQGDTIVGILEAITGQTFGDAFDSEITAAERADIASRWVRWAGVVADDP